LCPSPWRDPLRTRRKDAIDSSVVLHAGVQTLSARHGLTQAALLCEPGVLAENRRVFRPKSELLSCPLKQVLVLAGEPSGNETGTSKSFSAFAVGHADFPCPQQRHVEVSQPAFRICFRERLSPPLILITPPRVGAPSSLLCLRMLDELSSTSPFQKCSFFEVVEIVGTGASRLYLLVPPRGEGPRRV